MRLKVTRPPIQFVKAFKNTTNSCSPDDFELFWEYSDSRYSAVLYLRVGILTASNRSSGYYRIMCFFGSRVAFTRVVARRKRLADAEKLMMKLAAQMVTFNYAMLAEVVLEAMYSADDLHLFYPRMLPVTAGRSTRSLDMRLRVTRPVLQLVFAYKCDSSDSSFDIFWEYGPPAIMTEGVVYIHIGTVRPPQTRNGYFMVYSFWDTAEPLVVTTARSKSRITALNKLLLLSAMCVNREYERVDSYAIYHAHTDEDLPLYYTRYERVTL